MSDHDPDPMLEHLGALPAHDLPPRDVERLRARAHGELRRSDRRSRSWAGRLYRRVEPFATGALAASYLAWALSVVVP